MSARIRAGEGIHLVQFPQAEQRRFHVGDLIESSGIYRAIHGDHRLAHEVTLLSGQVFPRCRKCGSLVHFELVNKAPAGIKDAGFRVHLYEIPHPELAKETGPPAHVA
jgi:hypothetical protein